MKYQAITVKNFKGIQELKLDLSDGHKVVTLVGLNESGKTTILEAINGFAYGTEDLPFDTAGFAKPNASDLIPIAQRANFNGKTSINVEIKSNEEDQQSLAAYLKEKHNYILKSLSSRIVIDDSDAFVNSVLDPKASSRTWVIEMTGFPKGKRSVAKLNHPDPIWLAAVKHLSERVPRILYFPNFLFDFPKIITLEESSQVESEKLRAQQLFFRQVIRDILGTLHMDLEKHIIARANSSDINEKKALDSVLLQMGRAVSDMVFGAWMKMFNRPASDKKVRISIARDEKNRLGLSFDIEDYDGYFTINDRSLGFRWFFIYLLITTYRTERERKTTGLILLLDEPASNLHSTAQEQLLKSFAELTKTCTLIYTTHSRYLINPDWLESTYVVKNTGLDQGDDVIDYSAKRTNITLTKYRQFVGNHPDQTRYFQPILDVLAFRPSQLELVPAAVMLEGKNDYYFLRLAQLLVKHDNGLRFLPGGGAGSLDLPVSMYLAWGRPFLILLDSDSEGTTQRARYQELFGKLIEPHIVQLHDIEPEMVGKSMESLLADGDRLKVQHSLGGDDGKYRKKAFNLAVQHLVATKTVIDLTIESQSRTNLILENLLARLLAVS